MRVPPNVGDRIRLVNMADDPNPISTRQTGTVIAINKVGSGVEAWYQIDVNWDDGRSLMLACPPDEFEYIRS